MRRFLNPNGVASFASVHITINAPFAATALRLSK
jgi:hypothetical protein